MQLAKRCQFFFALTAASATFSNLVIFLNLELFFHRIAYLAIGLSLRTLSSSLFGYVAPFIINALGLKKTLIYAQYFAILILALLGFGFYTHDLAIVLFSTVIIGIPLILASIVVTICFRVDTSIEEGYRQKSGKKELYYGLSRLAACLLTASLFLSISIYIFLAATVLIYFFSLFIIFPVKFPRPEPLPEKIAAPTSKEMFQDRETWRFIFQLTSSWLLIAFVPLIASSNHIFLTSHLPSAARQSLWAVESAMMMLGGLLYVFVKKLRNNTLLNFVFVTNSGFLFLLLFSHSAIMVMIVAALISLTSMFSFYLLRDNFVVYAGDDHRKIHLHTSFSACLRDFICTLSPLYLTYLLTRSSLLDLIVLIFSLQIALYVSSVLIQKK